MICQQTINHSTFTYPLSEEILDEAIPGGNSIENDLPNENLNYIYKKQHPSGVNNGPSPVFRFYAGPRDGDEEFPTEQPQELPPQPQEIPTNPSEYKSKIKYFYLG